MHLRRGVVTRGDKWRYTKMSYYASVLDAILAVRPDADVHIFSASIRVRQNEQKWTKELVRREARCGVRGGVLQRRTLPSLVYQRW